MSRNTTPHVRGMNSVERLYENGESGDGGQRGEGMDAPEGEHGDAQQGGAHARGGDALPRRGADVPDDDGGDEPWHGVSDVGLDDGCSERLGLGAGVPAQRVPVHAGRGDVEWKPCFTSLYYLY